MSGQDRTTAEYDDGCDSLDPDPTVSQPRCPRSTSNSDLLWQVGGTIFIVGSIVLLTRAERSKSG